MNKDQFTVEYKNKRVPICWSEPDTGKDHPCIHPKIKNCERCPEFETG
jgi:hypothetical protein